MINWQFTDDTFNKFFVGFDRVLDTFNAAHNFVDSSKYPPYNIRKLGDDKFLITLAIAGFSKDDVRVRLDQYPKKLLVVLGAKKGVEEEDIVYKGIAGRSFERSWIVSDDVEVKGCKLENGMLEIELHRQVPEEKKPLEFEIK